MCVTLVALLYTFPALQLSLEEYLAQGVVTEYEIENCSPQQLEFLIRKRLTLASAVVKSPPVSPSRGRSRGPVRTPPVAAVQAAAATAPAAASASAAAPAAAEPATEEAPRKLVVPRAPPLTVGAGWALLQYAAHACCWSVICCRCGTWVPAPFSCIESVHPVGCAVQDNGEQQRSYSRSASPVARPQAQSGNLPWVR